jgi:hypothetical protein
MAAALRIRTASVLAFGLVAFLAIQIAGHSHATNGAESTSIAAIDGGEPVALDHGAGCGACAVAGVVLASSFVVQGQHVVHDQNLQSTATRLVTVSPLRYAPKTSPPALA